MATGRTTRDIANLFATSETPKGSTPYKSQIGYLGKGSLHTDGTTLFSYNEPIAKKVKNKWAWVTNRKFSVTTSKHTTFAYAALTRAGWEVHCSPSPDLCFHCGMPKGDHAGKQCLFDATKYKAA